MKDLFSINSFQIAQQQIQKNHPFLPDRHKFSENFEGEIKDILQKISNPNLVFSSFSAYSEWHGKPVFGAKMSYEDWLIHFVIFQELEKKLTPHFLPNTHFQISKIDALFQKCETFKQQHPNSFILKTDVKGFFSKIQHEELLKELETMEIEQSLSKLIKQFLKNWKNAFQQIQNDDKKVTKCGLPIGVELSYLLSAVYLDAVDKKINGLENVLFYARYVDDILIFVKEETDFENLIQTFKKTLIPLNLQLNLEKTAFQKADIPIQFLRQSI